MIIPKTKRKIYLFKDGGVDCSCPTHKGVKLSVYVKRNGRDSLGRVKYMCNNCCEGK